MKVNLIFKLLLLFLPIYIAIFYYNQHRTDNLIQHELDNKIKMVQVNVESSLHHFKTGTNNVNSFLTHNQEVLKILEKAKGASLEEKRILREKLYSKLKKPYERIKNIGGYIFHFVLPDNTSFLRMHDLKRYGDDLTKVRESYSYVHTHKKPIFVFENGELICAYRYIYPLFNAKKEYIGSFEISYVTQLLQSNLLRINKMHNHIILNKNLFIKHNYTQEELSNHYIQSIEHKDYLFGIDKDKRHSKLKIWEEALIKPIKKEIERNIALEKEFSVYQKKDDKIVVITFLPVKDFTEKIQGYIVAYDKSENIKNLLLNNRAINIIQFIALAVLFVFIYFLLKRKESLKKQVKEKTAEFEVLNKNLQKIVFMEVQKNRAHEKFIEKQQRIAALGEMMDAIAHQWKQPLSALLLEVQTFCVSYELNKKIEEKDILKLEENAAKKVEHLLETINEFRAFFRPNQQLTEVNLNYLVDGVLDLMRTDLIANKITIKTEIAYNLEIRCIPTEFKHVLINMIVNAKDAFNINKIEDRNIFIKGYRNSDNIVIEIEDNAGGISKDIIDKVFTSNFTTKKDIGGTGIGLYLVKQILDKLFATVEVENKNGGVCFKISLPVS